MEGTQRGLLLVLSAPSGGGKGTVLKEMFAQDGNLRLSVSATTRAPRPGEADGQQYYFLSQEEFEQRIASGGMLEYAQYVGHYYGTPRAPVEKWLDEGRDVVLEIEVQGGQQVKKLCPGCVSVFLMPPLWRCWKAACGAGAQRRTPWCAGAWKKRGRRSPTPPSTIISSITTAWKTLWQTYRPSFGRKRGN